MLEKVAENLWIADGSSVPFLGVPYPTRMTVARLADSSLWVCSPTRLDEGLRTCIDKQGPVRHLVSPNKIHHLFLGEWARAWPEAKLYASPGLARRRRDLTFHEELGDQPPPAWAEDIDQVIFRGSFALEEVAFFHRASRTAILTDLVQKFDPATLHGWRLAIMKLDGLVGANGSTPREWRLSFWNRAAARKAKQEVLAWDPERVIIAHGEWVRDNGRDVLERSLRWLG
jgi:hypothetical protein